MKETELFLVKDNSNINSVSHFSGNVLGLRYGNSKSIQESDIFPVRQQFSLFETEKY